MFFTFTVNICLPSENILLNPDRKNKGIRCGRTYIFAEGRIGRMQWNTLQKEQIELGRKEGLSERQIRLYAKHRYSFLQMQEIRTALADGFSIRDVRKLCRPWYSDRDMEKIRLRLKNKEKNPSGMSVRTWCAGAALLVLGAALIISGYIRISERPDLSLSAAAVTLKAGEPFEPMKYVASCSQKAEKLSLPSGVDTLSPGTKAAVYRLKAGQEEITRILLVKVEAAEEKEN